MVCTRRLRVLPGPVTTAHQDANTERVPRISTPPRRRAARKARMGDAHAWQALEVTTRAGNQSARWSDESVAS